MPRRSSSSSSPPRVSSGVVNLQEVDPNKDDHPKWMRDMWSEKVSAVSRDVIEAELESRLESVPPELSHVKPGEELFVTFGTKSVEDFIVTWLESAERLGLSPLFVGALDEDMHAFCKRRGVPSMLLKGKLGVEEPGRVIHQSRRRELQEDGDGEDQVRAGSVGIGVAPILTDADVVWLRDPRPYFRRGTYAVADALVSTDCIDVPADKADKGMLARQLQHRRVTLPAHRRRQGVCAGVEDQSGDVHDRVDARPARVQPHHPRGRGRTLARPRRSRPLAQEGAPTGIAWCTTPQTLPSASASSPTGSSVTATRISCSGITSHDRKTASRTACT